MSGTGRPPIATTDWDSYWYLRSVSEAGITEETVKIEKKLSISGVYIIADGGMTLPTARYIGRSTDIKDRIERYENGNSHSTELNNLMSNRVNNVVVYYVNITTEGNRINVEHTLIEMCGGVDALINDQPINGTIVNVQLPSNLMIP